MIDTKKTALSSTHIPNPGINIPSLTIRRVYENRTRDFVCVCVVYSEWGVFGVESISRLRWRLHWSTLGSGEAGYTLRCCERVTKTYCLVSGDVMKRGNYSSNKLGM